MHADDSSVPCRPRRGLRLPLRGTGHGQIVRRHPHDRNVAVGLRAQCQGGGRSEPEENNRAVETRGGSGRREAEPHFAA
jgi:hypothetical protein